MNTGLVISDSPKRKRVIRINYPLLVMIIMIFLSILVAFIFFRSPETKYEIEYVSYTMEPGDSLYHAIEVVNHDVSEHYDIRDLIVLAEKKNQISSIDVKAGVTYQIPKVVKYKYFD